MQAKLKVQLTADDLFRFNMHQTYTTIHGWISVAVAMLVFVMAVTEVRQGRLPYALLYGAMAIVIIAYIPFTLKTRAKHTIKTNEVLSKPLDYFFSEKAIEVMQGEEKGELPWDQVYKMIATKRHILIYSNRINAYIIPREQAKEQWDTIWEIAKKQLPPYRIRMK